MPCACPLCYYMVYYPDLHRRRSIRLKRYDYSQENAYFVTICVKDRECLFGDITNSVLVFNDSGKMIEKEWEQLRERFPDIELYEYIVMPNHFHGIIMITGRADTRPAPTIGDILSSFKSITTHQYIKGVKEKSWVPFNGKLWQRNYYEHVIRDEKDLLRIREYIITNPLNWSLDNDNPINIK
jgi:putative transposase